MGDVPAVGSLISLISRTGIRYEGSMYTVDLNDSTIALSHGERGLRARCFDGEVACADESRERKRMRRSQAPPPRSPEKKRR